LELYFCGIQTRATPVEVDVTIRRPSVETERTSLSGGVVTGSTKLSWRLVANVTAPIVAAVETSITANVPNRFGFT
jgi:hypothetical protein